MEEDIVLVGTYNGKNTVTSSMIIIRLRYPLLVKKEPCDQSVGLGFNSVILRFKGINSYIAAEIDYRSCVIDINCDLYKRNRYKVTSYKNRSTSTVRTKCVWDSETTFSYISDFLYLGSTFCHWGFKTRTIKN